jgi:hypothetical protein
MLKNYDIVTGDFRYLDFSNKPFYFRNEILKIKHHMRLNIKNIIRNEKIGVIIFKILSNIYLII